MTSAAMMLAVALFSVSTGLEDGIAVSTRHHGSETVCGDELCGDTGGWMLVADDYASDYTGVPVANGTLGILPWKEPFSVRHLMLNNVSERLGPDGVNCSVRGINPFGLSMKINGASPECISEWRQTVDMRRAEHVTEFVADGKVRVRYRFVALRNLPYSMLMDVEVDALDDVALEFSNRMQVPDDYGVSERERKSFLVEGRRMDVLRTSALTLYGRYDVSAASAYVLPAGADDSVVKSGGPDADVIEFRLEKGRSAHFGIAASLCSTADFSDPWNESVRQLVYIDRTGPENVLAGHREEWRELWQGDIIIDGDIEAQKTVRLALFSLYGSCRENSRLSIPPMGLSSQGYNGHVFWDAEMWIFPPMLLLNRGIAESMLDYRLDRLDAARRRAMASGYSGAMFPWESDEFGEESTPVWALTGPMEHHVTADVGIAAWNYWCVTRDMDWLRSEGWPLLEDIAMFLTDRVRPNEDGSYSIAGVVGADEYANNVTDDAFTNAAVAKVMECAAKAAVLCGEPVPDEWHRIAGGLRILVGRDGVTLEYEGYDGRQIKQADANLLGYPLGTVTDPGRLLKDLGYYEDKVDPVNGPAMTYSVFCVQYARLGDADKAEEMFRRSYRPFVRPPFGAFAETPSSDNPYFMTGAGGLLQAVMNGFGGLDITDEGIVRRNTVLPASWERLVIRGVGPRRETVEIINPSCAED